MLMFPATAGVIDTINPSEYETLQLGSGDKEYARQQLLLKELEKDNEILEPR